MADKRFNLTFDVNANIDPIKAAANGLQQAFGKLKLSDSLQSSLDKTFSKLNNEIQNFESLASKGFTNLGDVSKAEKSFIKITDLLEQLKNQSKSITGLEPEKFLPKETIERVNSLRKSWGDLKKIADKGIENNAKIKAQNSEIKKAEQAVQNLTSQYNKLNSENKSLSSSKGINTKQINEYKTQIEEARKAQEQLLASGEKKSGAEYQDLEQQVKSANAAIAQLEKTNRSYDTTIQKNKATMNGLKTEISSTNASVTDMKNELTKLQDEAKNPEGLAQLRQQLAALKNINIDEIPTDLEEIKQVIDNLNSEELKKITQRLKEIDTSAEGVAPAVDKCGDAFDAMKNSAQGLDQTAREVENLHNQILQFFSIGNAVQLFKRAVKSAFDTVKELDATMTETAVVTDFTVSDMWEQLPTYAAEANKLGAAINDLYGSTTLYYQQGLQTEAAMALGIETTKMARIANIEAADATNLMTAALRGFNMELNETSAQKVNDIYSELAAITAADTQEIGVAMSKTASIASSANMEFETTAALLSQIIETTREAPETAGTAMKTIIARFSEVKELVSQGQLTGEDTEGEIIDVNKIQGALRSVGISMNEFFAGTEGLDDVLLKLASKWDTLDFTTQRYIATTAAGSRQQSRFIAMMSDYGRTQELVSAAYNSTGASQEQFEKTLDSLDAKLTKLKNAWDQFAMGLANNEFIKGAIDVLTGLLNTINSIIDGISGGNGLAKSVLSLGFAFSAFKLGKNFLGQSGIGAKLRMTLGKGTEKDAQVAGETVAQNLGTGIGKGIKNIKTKGLGGVLLEKIGITKAAKDFSKKDLTKTFGLDQLDFSNVSPEGLQNLKNNISSQLNELPEEVSAKVDWSAMAKAPDMSGVVSALGEAGDKVKIVGQDAQNAGAQVMKISGSMQTAATACTAAGLAFQGIASIMESLGADDSTVEFFRTFGSILMTLGPIIGIVGSAFTAAGSQITIAGISAQLAWWWVFLIIAAVAALTAGVIALAKAAKENSLAGQMEKAQKATAAAKEAAESAKTAYDDLLSARSEYSDLQATLDGLTKGTNEWKQALIEANAQVLELLSTYPELAKFISRGEDGQLTISDEGFDSLIEKQQASMQRAQAAAVASQMNETRIQQKIDERNVKEQFNAGVYYDSDSGMYHDKYGKSYSTLPDDYQVQQGSGSDLSFYYDQELMDKLSNILESGDLSDEAFQPLIEEYALTGETADETAARLRDLCAALNEYDAALLANQTQLQAQAETLLMAGADQEILDSEYNSSVVSGFAKRMTTQDYANREQEISDQYYQTSTTADDEARKTLMEQRELTVSGDESKDLQTLYADLAGLQSIEDIPEDIKDNNDALAEQIGKMLAAEDQIGKMEDFQKRLNQVNKNDADAARNIAGLMSGDATNFTKAQLDQVGNLSNYAKSLGYKDAKEMAIGLGYEDKNLSELEREDQQAFAKTQVARTEGMSDEDYQKAIDDWIATNGTVSVTAEVQMDIDSNQYKQQMQDAYDKASAGLQAKGIKEDSYKDLSIDTVSNLSKQTENMSNEAAQKYVENFNKVLSNSNLGESGTKQLENYLSTVDWSNMTDAVQAMDYMQSMGVDSKVIQEYWNTATDAANTYVSTLSEILSLTDRMQQKLSSVADISSRLEEGTASYEDMQKLVEAGADIGDFQLTPEGWKATAEQIGAATDKMKEYNAEQAREMADQQRQEFDEAKKLAQSGYGVANKELTTFEDGVYKGGDLSTVGGDNEGLRKAIQQNVATQLGIQQGENETEEAFLTRLQAAYDSYISLLNNGEDIQIIADKQAAMAEAAKYTAAENEARLAGGGITDAEAESIIYSAQNEAIEAGLDSNEMMQYADTLRQVNTELDEVTAAQVALANSKMNAGLGEIIDSYDEWSAVLDKDTGKLKDTSAEGVATYNKLKASVNKMLNTSEDLSDAFWDNADNMKNIEKAAKGDKKALGELQKAATQDYLVNLALDPNFDEDARNAILTLSDFIMDTDLPDLEAGVELTGQEDFITRCNDLIKASGMTAEQVSNAFKSMGYDVEFDPNPQTVTQVQAVPVTTYSVSGSMEDGSFKMEPTVEIKEIPYESSVAAPTIKTLTSTGTGGGGVSSANQSAAKSNKGGGGGGGGGSKEDTKTWKNPYDKFYNTTEKINELLRQRNKLESEFDRLASRNATTAAQLNKNLRAQLKNLQDQVKSQNVLISGKRKQLQNAANATMSVEEGKTISFQKAFEKAGGSGSISKYGIYNETTGQIEINWEALEALQKKDAEQGEAVEAYISYLETISGELEEAQDSLTEIEDNIIALVDAQLDARVELLTTLKDAIVEQYQREIDKLSELNDTINDSNSNILNGIQESIDLSRQIRDNTKTEEDIAEKEARLAFLRRDTSGANDLEIKQLEKELEDARESYSDTLIDQEIDRLSKQNDEAAEARQKQIDLMQKQLDYWQSSDYFNSIIEAMNETEALELWKEIQDFNDKTEAEKISLMREWNALWNKGNAGNAELAAADSMYKGDKYTLTDSKGNKYSNMTYNSSNDTWSNGKVTISGSDISGADIVNNTITTKKDLSSKPTPTAPTPTSTPAETYPYGKASETSGNIKQGAKGNAVKAIQYALNKLGYGNSGTSSVDGIFGSNTAKAVRAFQKAMGIKQDGIVGKNTREKFKAKKYLTGGLADYTGLAWLDGSKSKPELVLNAKDTENFIVLKDVLSDILKGSSSQTKNSGDNYYDFHITVEEIANDYDVEKMIQKVKEEINNDARYRNVNAINLLR
jgi:TP901 family phage tail tape measure protein